jgi:hypothetical protein
MLTPVLIYLVSHQFVHRHHKWRLPKEVCVGILFAIGVCCFTAVDHISAWRALLVPTALFSLLCFANCALISLCEREVDRGHGQTSLVLQFPRGQVFVQVLPWLIAILAGLIAIAEHGESRSASLVAAASGTLLGLLGLTHRRCGRHLSRVLADVALMTPVVPLFVSLAYRS